MLVNYRTDLLVRNNKLYTNRSYELLINNRKGEEYAEVSIPYSKMNKVSKVEAFIKDKNGNVVKNLKPGDIEERSMMADFSFYEDNFVKEFTLVHNVYPYTLCYKFQQQEDAFFYIDNWTPIINRDIPTINATLTLDVPRDYKIAFSQQFVDNFEVDTLEKSIKYMWKGSYSKQITPEIYAPEISCLKPMVRIVPDKFKYDQEGMNSSWKTYGNWEYRLIEGLNELPENEKRQIDDLIEGVKNDNEKVKILYHYLQDETRYINISIETGGMKPYPATYVAINKYGDCKALSNYFKSVLSYVGIPSFYTNVYAGDLIKNIDLNFPSMQFNHVILCVPFPKDTLWLDCTSNGPFNYLGTFTQNRDAFLISSANSTFIRTPALLKQDVLEIRKVHINSDSLSGAISNFRNTYKGKNYENLFSLSSLTSESKTSQVIRNNFIENDFDLINYKLMPVHRDSASIVLNYTAKADKLFRKYGKDMLIRIIPFSIPAFKEPKIRKCPVQIDYPLYKIDTLEYQLPLGYSLSNSFKNQTINSVFGTYAIEFQLHENTVKVVKSFLLNAGRYSLGQYADFYNFIKTVSDIDYNSYIVTRKKE
ncbi:MAG TPA: DUF3857 domain-containing protein [Paludibacter sp.]|nr:DUF3857 domain-containing protein [Paludibacter sp.]